MRARDRWAKNYYGIKVDFEAIDGSDVFQEMLSKE